MSATEHAEQSLLLQWAAIAKGKQPELDLLYAIPNAGGFSGGYKSNVGRVLRLRREGVKKGVPDLCLPVARGPFHALYIEMKKEKGGRLKPEQIEWHARLESQRNRVVVCKGWEAARDAITQYLTQAA